MSYIDYETASKDYARNLLFELENKCSRNQANVVITLLSYTFKHVNSLNNPRDVSFDQMVDYFKSSDPVIASMLTEYLDERIWDKVKTYGINYKDELLDYVILHNHWYEVVSEYTESTPDSIVALSMKLLEDMTDKKVCDVCCGSGTFITECYMNNNHGDYYAIDFNSNLYDILQIRNRVLGNHLNLTIGDIFVVDQLDNKFDYVFSNYPFSVTKTIIDKYIKDKNEVYPGLLNRSSDWIYNTKVLEMLNEKGKAIVIMTVGSVSNVADVKIKKFFIEKNYIETVITLPNKLFDFISIPTILMVLNKGKENRNITMVDASKVYQPERRKNTLSEENINSILDAIKHESDISTIVSDVDIIGNDYNLLPRRYIDKPITYENGVKFDSVIKSITRGAPCKADELDKISCKDETNNQFLMLANINEGIVDDQLPYITQIDEKYEKYCIKDNSLVMSKMGAPIKMAVVKKDPDKKILANGNLYVIELDDTKINPYYLNAYFLSEEGKSALERIMAGSALPSIPLKELKNLVIPLPSLEVQNKIAVKFLMNLDEIKILKMKIERAKQSLKNIYLESEEG